MHRHFHPVVPTRLDLAIAAAFPEISRRAARRLIQNDSILINGRAVSVVSRLVSVTDDVVILDEAVAIPVLQLRSDWLAVDKPSGLATQPMRDRSRPSLQDLVSLQLKRGGEKPDLFLVHRLDVGTSGVVVFARTRESAAALSRLFAGKEVRKHYLAIVEGEVTSQFEIDRPIGRAGASTFEISKSGKPASSLVCPVSRGPGFSLVEIVIATGRTHQIRVHLQSAGHPVLGDRKYEGSAPGAASFARLLLHAWKLEAEPLGTLTSPPPPDFTREAAHFGLTVPSSSTKG